MSNKHYPVQRHINVEQPGTASADAVIRLPDCLGKVNHRLYRQSRCYEAKVTIDSSQADGRTVEVYALADTWYLQGALRLAKSVWDKAMENEAEMNNGRKARWSDFRVAAGIQGASDVVPVQSSRYNLTELQFTAGEFYNSRIVMADGTAMQFTLGAGVDTTPGLPGFYNIVNQYDNQPGTNTDPTVPSTGPYSGLVPNTSPVQAASYTDDGNLPPYNETGYGSAIWVKVGTLHLSAGRQRLSTGFFKAPLGMIVLRGVGWLNNPDISVEAKSGDYKGVMANSMLE